MSEKRIGKIFSINNCHGTSNLKIYKFQCIQEHEVCTEDEIQCLVFGYLQIQEELQLACMKDAAFIWSLLKMDPANPDFLSFASVPVSSLRHTKVPAGRHHVFNDALKSSRKKNPPECIYLYNVCIQTGPVVLLPVKSFPKIKSNFSNI